MKDEVVNELKQVEEKLQKGEQLTQKDIVFLFGLSLIKDKKHE